MAKETRRWVHPNAIARRSAGETGRQLYYFRHWERFTLTFEDYSFTRWFASHTIDEPSDDPEFDRAAEKLAKEGWAALNKEEQRIFEAQQLACIGVKHPEGLNLEGWAKLEGGLGREEITSFSVEDDPSWRRDKDAEYEKTFTRLRVAILSAAEEHHGSMWVWGESMREISTDEDMPDDEDVLYLQFYMSLPKLKALAEEVAIQPAKPVLLLHAQGLLFRDEVDAALSEPWHPRKYVMIYDYHVPVVLNSLRFRFSPSGQPAPEKGTEIPFSLTAGAPKAEAKLSPRSNAIEAQVRGLKRAIWILAIAIVLAALIGVA
jgi:hypothetical protein